MLACFNVTEKIILVHVYILIHKLTIVTDNYGEKQHGFFFHPDVYVRAMLKYLK